MKALIVGVTILLSVGFGLSSPATDFTGDGKDDLAVFRPATGLWAVRGVTRIYFGVSGDIPAPGNYTGGSAAEFAIFRPDNGLWAIRGATRVYFGTEGDISLSEAGGGRWNSRGDKIYYDRGYVGVGVAEPDSFLHVSPSIKVGTMAISSPFIYLQNSAGGVNALGLYSTARALYLGSGNTKLTLRTSGWPRLTIDSAGRVGIGTQTPASKLAVRGLSGTGSYNNVKVNTATGDFYYNSSSRRCKKKISKLESDFHLILKAEPKKYVDRTSGREEIGYIAEEFEGLGLDDLVILDGSGRPDGLKYERISLYLVELVKEQQSRIEALEKALADQLSKE
jgi:hypothetical protein